MTITFEMAIKKCVKYFWLFRFTKVLTKPSLKGSASLSSILHSTINYSSSYNINQIRWSSVQIIIIDYGKLSTIYRCVMVVSAHKCVQQTHLLALHLETIRYIPYLLNALNGLVYFLMVDICNFVNLVLIIKVVWLSNIPRQAINTLVIKMTSQY